MKAFLQESTASPIAQPLEATPCVVYGVYVGSASVDTPLVLSDGSATGPTRFIAIAPGFYPFNPVPLEFDTGVFFSGNGVVLFMAP